MGKRGALAIAAILCAGFFSPLWPQLGNSVLTGSVEDASKARIPGVEVIATNTQIGVATTVVTNEAGVYNIPNLVPGVYTLRASLPSFQPQSYQNIVLGGSETRRFNFSLQVAAAATVIEVTVDAQQLLTQSSGTVAELLPQQAVKGLPLVGNDVLDLINVLPGVQLALPGTMTFGTDVNQSGGASRWTTLAGVSATFVNTSVNGVNVTGQLLCRYWRTRQYVGHSIGHPHQPGSGWRSPHGSDTGGRGTGTGERSDPADDPFRHQQLQRFGAVGPPKPSAKRAELGGELGARRGPAS